MDRCVSKHPEYGNNMPLALCYIAPNKNKSMVLLSILHLAASSNKTRGLSRYRLTSIGISMLMIRWSRNHLIFNMEIQYPGKTVLILRRGPGLIITWQILQNSHHRYPIAYPWGQVRKCLLIVPMSKVGSRLCYSLILIANHSIWMKILKFLLRNIHII